MTPENLHVTAQNLSRVVTFMISSGVKLFRVPPTLATDIRAYWDQRKLSPDSNVNKLTLSFKLYDSKIIGINLNELFV